MKFKIEVDMQDRWVPHFLSMLKDMQRLGSWGASRTLSFYADGDGDFRPRFQWVKGLPDDAKPVYDNDGDRLYDAG